MVESTRLLVPLLLVALATSASFALRPAKPDATAETTLTRLTVTAIPSAYVIELTPDLVKKTFTGSVKITAKVSESETNQVMFHAAITLNDLKGTVTYPEQAGKTEETLKIEKVPNTPDMYTATWVNASKPNDEIALNIEYSGSITEDMDGFYISKYTDNGVEKFLASTQFESVSARKAFPCLDEPKLKATFTMTIKPPAGYGVLFNTEETPETIDDPSKFTFKQTPAMSTYLVAFVIYDIETFKPYEKDPAKRQRVWSREEMSSYGQLAWDAGLQCLDKYSSMFKINYFPDMNTKMDQIAIPDFSAGAMENWGLVTYRESELLGDPKTISISDQRNIIETVAHEFAHQWFGDYVSPDYWNVLWLNEGFATYWMYHVDIDLYNGYNMENAFVAIDMEVALEADAYDTTHAMTVELEENAAFEGKFDDITYEKAGSVIRMMKLIVGDSFNDGLSKYLTEKKFNNAVPEDLFNHLKPADDDIFVEAMLSWSKTPGYPVVTVTRNYDNNSALIDQRRYLINNPNNTDSAPWIIPITYTNDLGDDIPMQWLKVNDTLTIVDLNADNALIVNLKRTGFYRVNYDVANWELIASTLQNNQTAVEEVTRAAIISDAFALARSGLLEYYVALDLSTYLINEINYVPWEAAFRHLSFLDTCLAGATETYSEFKKYMVSLVTNSFNNVTFDVNEKDTAERRLHRENIIRWSCKIGLQECSDKARAALSDTTTIAELSPDVQGVVLCEGVRTNESMWDELTGDLLNGSTTATYKLVIMKALGCTEKTDNLKKLLAMARDPNQVRPQDIASAYAAVYNNPMGVDLVLDDINTNTGQLINQFSGLQKILNGLGDKITTEDQLKKLQGLSSNNDVKDMPAYLAAVAKANAQVEWVVTYETPIKEWLVNYNSAVSTVASTLLLALAALFTFLNR